MHRARFAVPLIALCLFSAARAGDPLADEIAKWSAFVNAPPAHSDEAEQTRVMMKTGIERAEKALKEGRRWLAVQRLFAVRNNLAAVVYSWSRPPIEHTDQVKFEAEWVRMGGVLRADLKMADPAAFAKLEPAAVRAVAEAAQGQVGVYYDASVVYSRNTSPDVGLFYVGDAVAQRESVELARRISEPAAAPAPQLRSLASDIESLQNDLLAAYKPPASIDAHPDFIVGNASLKEARDLNAGGLRYGALLRYLQAALRTAAVRSPATKLDAEALAARLHDFETRLADPKIDHTIGRIFLEAAQSDPTSAVPIATDVLPRYFAALEPAKVMPPKPAPSVTVTLVRWPFT